MPILHPSSRPNSGRVELRKVSFRRLSGGDTSPAVTDVGKNVPRIVMTRDFDVVCILRPRVTLREQTNFSSWALPKPTRNLTFLDFAIARRRMARGQGSISPAQGR